MLLSLCNISMFCNCFSATHQVFFFGVCVCTSWQSTAPTESKSSRYVFCESFIQYPFIFSEVFKVSALSVLMHDSSILPIIIEGDQEAVNRKLLQWGHCSFFFSCPQGPLQSSFQSSFDPWEQKSLVVPDHGCTTAGAALPHSFWPAT